MRLPWQESRNPELGMLLPSTPGLAYTPPSDPTCDAMSASGGPIPRDGVVSMHPLPRIWRCAQVSIFLVFLADTYVYSILDTLLGRYLGTLGLTQTSMSIAFAIYGLFQLVATVVLLLLQCWAPIAFISLQRQFHIVLLAVSAALASTLLMVCWPASYQLLLLARGLQGTFGAVCCIYAMILLARGFPAEWQMQAIAFMTAGK